MRNLIFEESCMEEISQVFNQLLNGSELAQLSVILLVVVVVAWITKLLKQPLIIWYLLAGVLVGPLAFGLVELSEDGHSFIELFSHLGIALLLFMVGVWLNINVIKEQGKTALGIWFIQIISSVLLWFLFSYFLWYEMITSLFIAIGLTFSSTIVIVKLLSDKEEDQTIYGKISIGVLIVQDLVVMLLLMLIALKWWGWSGGVMFIEWILLLVMVVVFAKYALPKLVKRLAQSQEFLLLIGIAWCLILGTLFQLVWFSFEIWCLLAGMSFATSPYRMQIMAKLKPLRDFFLVLFFIALWLELSRDGMSDHIPLLIWSLCMVLLIKPTVIYLTSIWFGYTHQVAFKSWISLGQISEFWFIILGMGMGLGYVQDESLMSVMVLVGLITIGVSSYLTMRNNKLYAKVQTLLWHDNTGSTEELLGHDLDEVEVILFGFGRIWSQLAKKFNKKNISHVVIDHNPELAKHLEDRRGAYIFADASSVDIYRHMFHPSLKMVVSTIRDLEDDLLVIQEVQGYNSDIIIVVVSNHKEHALQLYAAGADYVIMPDALWAKHTTNLIDEVGFDIEKFLKEKLSHLDELHG